MEASVTTSAGSSSWDVVPTSTLAGIILAILFFYFFFRHMLLAFMLTDVILGWLRKFNWFPKEGKRRKTIIHWVIAFILFVGFLSTASYAGWLEFIPK